MPTKTYQLGIRKVYIDIQDISKTRVAYSVCLKTLVLIFWACLSSNKSLRKPSCLWVRRGGLTPAPGGFNSSRNDSKQTQMSTTWEPARDHRDMMKVLCPLVFQLRCEQPSVLYLCFQKQNNFKMYREKKYVKHNAESDQVTPCCKMF